MLKVQQEGKTQDKVQKTSQMAARMIRFCTAEMLKMDVKEIRES